MEEFKKYDTQLTSNTPGGPIGPNLLRDVCFVISALGPVAQYVMLKRREEDPREKRGGLLRGEHRLIFF